MDYTDYIVGYRYINCKIGNSCKELVCHEPKGGDYMESILLKVNEQWFNNIKNYYENDKVNYFANYWSIKEVAKKINDGADVYLYIDEPDKNYINIVAQGIFRNKIYSISDPSILGKDIEPKAEVQEAYRLYESANGAATYSDFKYLLQNHGCSKGSNIKINDHTIIHNTIISDLSFNKITYDMTNGQISQTGVSYIEKVEGNKIYFV